jgi:hypothetical protein
VERSCYIWYSATCKISKFEAGYEYLFNINPKNSSGDLISGGNGSTEGWKPGENEGGDATETNPEIPSGYETIPVNGDTDLPTCVGRCVWSDRSVVCSR